MSRVEGGDRRAHERRYGGSLVARSCAVGGGGLSHSMQLAPAESQGLDEAAGNFTVHHADGYAFAGSNAALRHPRNLQKLASLRRRPAWLASEDEANGAEGGAHVALDVSVASARGEARLTSLTQ